MRGKMVQSVCLAMVLASFAGSVAARAADAPAAGKDGPWMTSVKDAMSKAQKEQKDILWDFTGSDWCGWCIRLDKEVFSQSEFVNEAPKSFVLLKLDFPKRTQLPGELRAQNEEWMRKFGVQGFPTLFLTDAKARPYAQTGYKPGGPVAYLEHLAALRKVRIARDKAFAAAEQTNGAQKARLLDEAIGAMSPALIASSYRETAEQIIALDPENEASLKAKYQALLTTQGIMALIQARNLDGAAAKADAALKELGAQGPAAQEVLYLKSMALFYSEDLSGALAALDAALKAAPESAKSAEIKTIIDRLTAMQKQQKKQAQEAGKDIKHASR